MATSQATAAQEFKAAFYEAALALFANDDGVLVIFGAPSQAELAYDDVVAFLGVQATQQEATLSTNRSREEVLTLTVRVDCQRAGEIDQEQVASDAAYGILRRLEEYVRVTDTTLGGVVRHCFLTSHQSEGATELEGIANGRNIVIDAVFTAHVRITS